MADSTMLAAARLYAQRGWRIFQLAPGRKIPLYASPHPRGSTEHRACRGGCGRLGHGVLDATSDPATVTAWWTRTPTAGIGLATGAPGPDVVDIDCKQGAPGPANFARLRDAGLLRGAFMVVPTPSGGWHCYYAGTSQGNSTRSRHGVDFRGRGGYVVAPPTMVDGKRYEVAEYREPTGATVDWAAIRDFLDPPRPPRQYARPAGSDFGGLVRWLEARPAGDRNAAVFWAACRALEAGAGDDVLDQLEEAICRAGHNRGDAARTIQSARRRGASAR